MEVHRVQGRDMRTALERARAELGAGAVVISHRGSDGQGVTLAVTPGAPQSAQALAELRSEARVVLERRQAAKVRPGTADVQRCLRRCGASQKLVDRITEAVAGRIDEGQHPLDLAAEEIGTVFPTAQAPRSRGTSSILVFVGQTGVGKTTAIAKLASRMIRAGRRVALATLDCYRIGSVEQTKAYGKALGVPVFPLRDAAQITVELAGGAFDVVLLDTTGNLERDADQVKRLEEAVERATLPAGILKYVVVSAVSSQVAMDEASRACSAIDLDGCVITKLDETALPAPVLEHAVRRKLPIAFLSNGPDIARDFHRPGPRVLGDLMLRGRVS